MSTSSVDQGASTGTTVVNALSPFPMAYLIHDLRPGGAERVFVTYVNEAREIAPLVVVVRRRPGLEHELPEHARLFDLGTRSSAPVPRLPPPTPEAHGALRRIIGALLGPWSLARKALRLHRLLHIEEIDAVSTFLHKSHAIALFLKLTVRPDLKVVVNVHELPSQHIPTHFGPLGRVLMTLMTRFALPRADLIVAVASGVERDLVETFGVPAERVVVVGNPVQSERIRQEANAEVRHRFFESPEAPIVIGVGRLVTIKGFDILIDAFAALPSELGARLVLIGDGPERSALEQRVRALRLEGSVAFVGYDPNPWRYLARADVFVLPSRTEALPSVIAEALTLGVPTVAAACSPGVAEYLQDGRAGLLVPAGDATALAHELARILRDPGLRAELAARARAGGRELPGPTQVRRYERTVLEALRGGRPLS